MYNVFNKEKITCKTNAAVPPKKFINRSILIYKYNS